MLGTRETCYVAIHESEYIPVTEHRDAHPLDTTLDDGFEHSLAFDDDFDLTQCCCPLYSYSLRRIQSVQKVTAGLFSISNRNMPGSVFLSWSGSFAEPSPSELPRQYSPKNACSKKSLGGSGTGLRQFRSTEHHRGDHRGTRTSRNDSAKRQGLCIPENVQGVTSDKAGRIRTHLPYPF
jgi:hypothetical protein